MDFARMFQNATPMILQGLWLTVRISIVSLLIGMVLGLITCLFRLSNLKVMKFLAGVYIWIIRGTPMLVQVFYFYFAVPQLIQAITGAPFRIDRIV